MNIETSLLKVNASRLLKNIDSLAQIGRTSDGGVSRPAFSEADVAARNWFRKQVEDAGLKYQEDGAGNLSAVLPSANRAAKTLLAGSHLDTVPNGGRFDGSLGVLCALESLQTIKEANLNLTYHLEAISFSDEEAAVVGMLGSRALTDQLTEKDLESAVYGWEEELVTALSRLNLTRTSILSARRDPTSLAGFIEVHIEQGTRLEESGLDIGVVTSIVGIRSYWLRFVGQTTQVGVTPMENRDNVLYGAASFVLRARDMVVSQFSPGTVNCGQLKISPEGVGIVPIEAKLALEFRHSSAEQLDRMELALFDQAEKIASEHDLSLYVNPVENCPATFMHEELLGTVEKVATHLGLKSTRLISFAGHDAQMVAAVVPTALFFVPSVGGFSHTSSEFTHDDDVINGANVLLHTLLQLATDAR